MDTRASRFFEELKDKQVWFVGIGVSHTAAIGMFAAMGIPVTACDKRTRDEVGEDLCSQLEKQGAALRLGDSYLDKLTQADVVFRTPGMYYNLPVLQEYRKKGGILTSEMEVFFDLCPCPVFAVTGSDGKTTTTSVIAEMLHTAGRRVHLGGNIGKALLPELPNIRPEDCAVVELSSFQLISMRCAPQVAVVTNVTPNHLDVHGTMEEYTDAKRNLFLHQGAFSRTVLGVDNDICASFASQIRGECMGFSLEGPVENGAYYNRKDGGIYTVNPGRKPKRLMDASDIRIPGIHNIANYLAAICAVRDWVDTESIRRVAREFAGVEHRIEFIRELDGVRWYNDSIATTPSRATACLRAFDKKIILLAGGYDKKIPFEPLAPEIIQHVKELILCGATADKIEGVVTAHPDYTPGNPQIHRTEDLEESTGLAKHLAQPGDVVCLSPACASFDQFPNFGVRGRHFKDLVNAL